MRKLVVGKPRRNRPHPREDIEVIEGDSPSFRILDSANIRQGQNIHYKGTDSLKGRKLVWAITSILADME